MVGAFWPERALREGSVDGREMVRSLDRSGLALIESVGLGYGAFREDS